MEVTPYFIASRFIGLKEVSGKASNPAILAMLQLDNEWPKDDEVPWCSAFCNYIMWLLNLNNRSKNLLARSWLNVGQAIELTDAKIGFDVVILKRGAGVQPGPEVINAPGHVGLYSGYLRNINKVAILSGNQNNSVSVELFSIDRVIGVRRIIM